MTTTCFVCHSADRSRGLLCERCARDLRAEPDRESELCPEQIVARSIELQRGKKNAVIVDEFGAGHVVVIDKFSASIGRASTNDVSVAERTVSIAHALLEHRDKSNAWFIADTDSENGTYVNGDRVERRWPLEHADRIALGRRVAFFFVPIDDDDVDSAAEALRSVTRETRMDTRRDVRFDDGRPLKIRAVTEGGAIASWGDDRAQLSELEYELLVVLEKRFSSENELDAAVRGFVPASHLLEVLSFKSEAPTHANLRGLVRKVRGKLAAGNPSLDVIESKKGLGYRLARPLDLG